MRNGDGREFPPNYIYVDGLIKDLMAEREETLQSIATHKDMVEKSKTILRVHESKLNGIDTAIALLKVHAPLDMKRPTEES